MKASDFLAGAEALPFADLAAITGGRGLLVVAPHPDDESLGCGGVMAEACARGVPVRLLVLSDGAGSHPNSRAFPPGRLRALREQETLAAAAELGLPAENVRFLRLPDTRVPSRGPEAETAAAAIAAEAAACDAGAVLVTWRHDPHCDHEAAAALVELARPRMTGRRILAYPVWGWALPDGTEVGPEPRGCRIDMSAHLAAKARAVACHRSQTSGLIADDPDGFRLDDTMLARAARPFEILLEVAP